MRWAIWPLPRMPDDDTRLHDIYLTLLAVRTDIHVLNQRITAMSDSVHAELAAERVALDNLRLAVSAGTAKIADLAAKLAAAASGGAGATAEELAEMAADAAEIQAQADAINAAVAPTT